MHYIQFLFKQEPNVKNFKVTPECWNSSQRWGQTFQFYTFEFSAIPSSLPILMIPVFSYIIHNLCKGLFISYMRRFWIFLTSSPLPPPTTTTIWGFGILSQFSSPFLRKILRTNSIKPHLSAKTFNGFIFLISHQQHFIFFALWAQTWRVNLYKNAFHFYSLN